MYYNVVNLLCDNGGGEGTSIQLARIHIHTRPSLQKDTKKRALSTVTAQGLPHPVHKHEGKTLKWYERVLVLRLCTRIRVVVLSCRVSTDSAASYRMPFYLGQSLI